MGLLGELKKYVNDALPGGLLNPEVNTQGILDGAALSTTAVPVLGDLLGLGADLHRYKNEPESRTLGNFALSGLGMLPFVPAMTAWHGSPHKFDKFSLDKIGTGEGAQAYGHGLYLAESPQVAKSYVGGKTGFISEPLIAGKTIDQLPNNVSSELDRVSNGTLSGILDNLRQSSNPTEVLDFYIQSKGKGAEAAKRIKEMGVTAQDTTNLYKTDIPDEAVARFLDWDKPLSQQAPEVQAALKSMTDDVTKGGFDLSRSPRNVARAFDNSSTEEAFKALQQKYGITNSGGQYFDKNGNPVSADAVQRHINKIAGKGYDNAGQLYSDLTHILGSQSDISATLRNNGIPGIRYLDGGSRSAGQGSSNFVVFDDQLPRILERNGVPTGQQPWKPGEWQGLLK